MQASGDSEIQLASPGPGEVLSAENLQISGSSRDLVGDLQITVSGADSTQSFQVASGPFSITPVVDRGVYLVTVRGVSESGQQVEQSRLIWAKPVGAGPFGVATSLSSAPSLRPAAASTAFSVEAADDPGFPDPLCGVGTPAEIVKGPFSEDCSLCPKPGTERMVEIEFRDTICSETTVYVLDGTEYTDLGIQEQCECTPLITRTEVQVHTFSRDEILTVRIRMVDTGFPDGDGECDFSEPLGNCGIEEFDITSYETHGASVVTRSLAEVCGLEVLAKIRPAPDAFKCFPSGVSSIDQVFTADVVGPDAGSATYQWTISGEGRTDPQGTGPSFPVTGLVAGTYTVSLVVTFPPGCGASAAHSP